MFCFIYVVYLLYFFFQAEDGIRDGHVTGVQTCALPISFMKIHQMEYDDILQSELPLVVADMEGENAFRFHWPQNGILVMGNEGKGPSSLIKKNADHFITIPPLPGRKTESLNVGMACTSLLTLRMSQLNRER